MSVFGTARFATREELREADLLRDRGPGEMPDRLLLGWWYESKHDFEPIEYGGDLHQLIIGGTGSGKFTTALAPLLLGSSLDDQSVVMIDPKGEIARLAGPWFQVPFADKPSVHLLDPWDLCQTGQTEALNVLETLTPDNPDYVDDARSLADALIVTATKDNTHWDNTARNYLAALLLQVALSPREEGNRNLMRVYELAATAWELPPAYLGPKQTPLSGYVLQYMRGSALAEGAIHRGAESILGCDEKERSGIISGIKRDLAWVDSPAMRKVTSGKSLDLGEAATGGQKYFIAMRPDFFESHRGWLRLAVTTFSKAFKRYPADQTKPRHKRWRHIVIDEFANLSEMKFVLHDVSIARGYDIKYHLAVQDLTQLARVYEKGWETFINNAFLRAFGIGDLFTAEYISRLLGTATVDNVSSSMGTSGGDSYSQSDSVSTNKGTSSNFQGGSTASHGESNSFSTSFSETRGWSQQKSMSSAQRPLLTPDEVRRQSPKTEFLFFRGLHPIECWRPSYWEIFPSLPKYPLKEVLGTIGRAPWSDHEARYFNSWRQHPLLMAPEPEVEIASIPAPEPPEPIPLPPVKKGIDWTLLLFRIVFGFLALVLFAWCWEAVQPIWRNLEGIFGRSEEIIRPDPPISPPLPPQASTRPSVVDWETLERMPAGAASRDRLLKIAEDNAPLCNPQHADEELKLQAYALDSARAKIENVPLSPARAATERRYINEFRKYAQRQEWSDEDRRQIYALIIRAIHENYGGKALFHEIGAALDRLYANHTCPMGQVPDDEYELPNGGGSFIPEIWK
jgi:type IV secretion system protein VirD4